MLIPSSYKVHSTVHLLKTNLINIPCNDLVKKKSLQNVPPNKNEKRRKLPRNSPKIGFSPMQLTFNRKRPSFNLRSRSRIEQEKWKRSRVRRAITFLFTVGQVLLHTRACIEVHSHRVHTGVLPLIARTEKPLRGRKIRFITPWSHGGATSAGRH